MWNDLGDHLTALQPVAGQIRGLTGEATDLVHRPLPSVSADRVIRSSLAGDPRLANCSLAEPRSSRSSARPSRVTVTDQLFARRASSIHPP